MKKLNYLFGMLFLAVAFTYCTDNDNNDNNEPEFKVPTATEFTEIRQGFLDGITQQETFDAAAGSNFTSPKGVIVSIYGLTLDGQPVTGDAQLRYIELFDIGSIALANKPLLGKDYLGNVGPLATGGEFFIEVTQNGTQLDGSASLQVPQSHTKGADPEDMTAWSMEGDEEWGVWEEGNNAGMERGGNGSGKENYYYCWFPFSWTNIDWLVSLDGEKTELRVRVPDGYNKDNCSVYAAYFNMQGTLAAFDVYDATGKYFTEHTGIAPIGYKMFVIFVSGDAQTKQFVYATKLVTVEDNQYITFTAEDLHSANIQQVIDAINGLYD
jgi:hypothetical protein